MNLDPSIFVAKFVEEGRDRAKALGETLLKLEEQPGASDLIAEAMRDAHTIKGSALMLGFTDISQIAHQLEDLFVAAKTNPTVLDASAFDVVFGAVDRIISRIDGLARGELDPVEVGDVSDRISSLLGKTDAASIVEPPDDKSVQPAPSGRSAELRQSIRVPLEKLDRLAHLAPEMVVQSLKAFERHTELRRLERVLSRMRDRAREARLTPEAGDLDRGAQLAEYADALDSVTRRMREFLVNFSDDRVRLNLITEELRQTVIELTMLPVASVFDAFPRAVRDLARSFDKEIDLTINGRDTELDKKIIEHISEPLTHLVRNAVDHGIEATAERERAGKPAAGRLVLSAEQQGNRILISLKDDGRGIDVAQLRAVAIERKVAPAAEIRQWPDDRVLDVIFEPGFSTGHRQKRRRASWRDRARVLRAWQGHHVHVESSAVACAVACRIARSGRRAVCHADERDSAHRPGW
jgi:two-component system, chemotaxis family, sensor kinase CheA